ncbi:SlyX protein [Solimonas sp. K1W22B-7]|uniref:SlyX family protein n=1 Tax=Solimonas sp. K1W22B-7 TaxID=2303331 RepID=UPI000E335226|nr:SlyX family protein [Solimonas sp. K1W22B-7]AXQ27705.1 SlyX protein [Solimonas sp. K1W22B-7]
MDEDRLIELEIRFAHQEETLRVLNDLVIAQQERIARLEQICRQLAERAAGLGDGLLKATVQDEVPPHY